MTEKAGEILGRIQQYLVAGGLFNPEAMEHDKVQRMVIDARDEIHALASALATAEFRIKEYLEQAEQGIWAEHECPAMFACSFIVADSEGYKASEDSKHG